MKARTALADSTNALSQAKEAESSLGRAEADSSEAQTVASNALTLARDARQEAHSFEKDIVSAKKQAANAESHLAEALKQAADASRELNEYKASNAPRRLDPKQQALVASRLGFPKEHVDLTWQGSFEKGQFAADIEKALRMAQWDVNNSQSLDFGGVRGVVILTMPTDRSEQAGSQLFQALVSQGIATSLGSMVDYIPGYSKLKVDSKSQELRSDTRLLVIVGDHA